MKIAHRVIIALMAISICLAPNAMAQTLTQTQPLSFGDGVITDNLAQHEIVLMSDGTFTNDPEIIIGTSPREGIYLLTGAPQSAAMTVMITLDQNINGPGQDFFLDNFDIDAPATTDLAGSATIRVGGRMRTSGNGILYNASSSFTGLFTIEVDFP